MVRPWLAVHQTMSLSLSLHACTVTRPQLLGSCREAAPCEDTRQGLVTVFFSFKLSLSVRFPFFSRVLFERLAQVRAKS